MRFLDIHTHNEVAISMNETIHIVNHFPTEQPFAKVRSIGLHPYFLNEVTWRDEMRLLEAHAANEHIWLIGECGLDKTCPTPSDLQEKAFLAQIAVSEVVQKPLLIHCVRAFNEILALKKKKKPKQAWILHGYNKNLETAKQLIRQNFYLSFGKALFHENVASVFQKMPLEKCFLETDTEANIKIESVYERAASLREISTEALQIQIAGNWERISHKI